MQKRYVWVSRRMRDLARYKSHDSVLNRTQDKRFALPPNGLVGLVAHLGAPADHSLFWMTARSALGRTGHCGHPLCYYA